VTFSAHGRTDAVHQLLARRRLPDVSQSRSYAPSATDRNERSRTRSVRRAPLEDLRGCGDPLETRHRDVADDHIGRQLLGGEHQRQTVVHLSDHFELRLEQPGQECRGLRGGRGSSASRPSDCSSLPDRTRPPDRSSVRDRRGRAEVRRQTQLGLPRSWKPRAARGTGIGADLLGKPPGASGISEVLRVTWRLLSAFCHSIQAVSASFGTSIFIHGLEPNRPVALGPLSIPVPSRTRGGPQFGKAQWGPALCGGTVGGARGDSSRVSDTDKGSTLRLARAGPGEAGPSRSRSWPRQHG
jgi:hypothetical protein